MQVPMKLTTGTAAGGGAALLLAAKLTILTMWLLGISDANAPFEVIDAATTIITAFWTVALTGIGAAIAHFIPTHPKEVSDVRTIGLSHSIAAADRGSLPAGNVAGAGAGADGGVRNAG